MVYEQELIGAHTPCAHTPRGHTPIVGCCTALNVHATAGQGPSIQKIQNPGTSLSLRNATKAPKRGFSLSARNRETLYARDVPSLSTSWHYRRVGERSERGKCCRGHSHSQRACPCHNTESRSVRSRISIDKSSCEASVCFPFMSIYHRLRSHPPTPCRFSCAGTARRCPAKHTRRTRSVFGSPPPKTSVHNNLARRLGRTFRSRTSLGIKEPSSYIVRQPAGPPGLATPTTAAVLFVPLIVKSVSRPDRIL